MFVFSETKSMRLKACKVPLLRGQADRVSQDAMNREQVRCPETSLPRAVPEQIQEGAEVNAPH